VTVLTALDLFAGAGGLTLGLQRAGFTVLGAVEMHPLACSTYADNHVGVRLWQDDIRDLTGEQILAGIGLRPGQLDLLAGCPPCQGFSSLRTLNGRQAPSEPRNDLVREYGRLVASQARDVLHEDRSGLELRDERMAELTDLLEDLGYPARTGCRVLNAADYGVPQNRRRLVLAAVRGRELEPAAYAGPRRSVREAFAGLPLAGESGDPLHDLPEKRSVRVAALIRQVPVDGGSRSALEEQLSCHTGFDGFKDVYGRMAWDRPAPTITGGCHNPSKGRFLHPDQHRAVTLREAALLQGFPRGYSFRLERGKLAAALMIGNAIPPDFVAAHAAPIAALLRTSGADCAATATATA
jgi:DNA (cytosine-5)-methyltransferase 1